MGRRVVCGLTTNGRARARRCRASKLVDSAVLQRWRSYTDCVSANDGTQTPYNHKASLGWSNFTCLLERQKRVGQV